MRLKVLALIVFTALAIAITGRELYLLGLLPVLLMVWFTVELLDSYSIKITFEYRIFILVSLMTGWWVLSVVWSATPSSSMVTIYLPIVFYSSYVLATLWVNTSNAFLQRIDIIFISVITFSAAYAIYQQLTGAPPSSLMANKNNHAALLNLGIFFALAQVMQVHEIGRRQIILIAALLLMTIAMFLVGSRGAMIAYAVAILFLAIVMNRRLHRVHALYLIVIPASAFYLASVTGENHVIERTATLANFGEGMVLNTRLNIWSDSLVLLKQHPIMGHGIGTFWMLFPMVRDPVITPFYFFVHNDYLQMWIELGIIGLLIFLSLLSYLAMKTYRLLHDSQLSKEDYLSVTAIFAGMMTLLIHSSVTFNLNLPVFLLILGVSIARLQAFDMAVNSQNRFTLIPKNYMTRWGYRLVVLLLFLLSANFSLSFFTSSVLLNMATTEIVAGDIESGSKKLSYSRTISPDVDIFHMERANILRKSLHRYWESRIFDMSVEGYQRCIELNRYRVACYFGLADLYTLHPEREKYFHLVEPLYKEGLIYEPASPVLLANYAQFKAKQGDYQSAYQILKGTEEYQMARRAGEDFYLITYIRLLKHLGKEERLEQLQLRLQGIIEQSRRRSS